MQVLIYPKLRICKTLEAGTPTLEGHGDDLSSLYRRQPGLGKGGDIFPLASLPTSIRAKMWMNTVGGQQAGQHPPRHGWLQLLGGSSQ